ncbi:MAG: DNA methyltransferase [Planctomycetota bacterium]|nr:DNA methyltransferase [Planctomycetota bacterium]MDI6788732.1 DNA methyltransferase [Planctomycetota bacterium]
MIRYKTKKDRLVITDNKTNVKYLIREQLAVFTPRPLGDPAGQKTVSTYLKLLTRTIENNDYIELPSDNVPLVLVGDVLHWLRRIPSESISCIVTSPPYWNLRDYYVDGQIGQEKTPEEYTDKLLEVSNELLRILKKDGAYFLNIGDTYIDKGLQMIPQRLAYRMLNEVKSTGKNRRKIGWLLRNQIIWYKPDHMPSPVKTRFTNTYEPILFFTRDDWEKNVYFDIDKIRIPYKSDWEDNNIGLPHSLSETEYKRLLPEIEKKNNELGYNGKFRGNEVNIGASPGGRASVTGINYIKKRKVELPQEIICDYLREWREKRNISVIELDKKLGYKYTAGHWFRKDAGGSLPTLEDWLKLKEILKFDNKYDKEMTEIHYVLQTIRKHPDGKNPGDFWEMKTAKFNKNHFSVFPEELPRRAILACCPPDGIVLDPFAGSGTTAKVAQELNRKSIMIELQPKFVDIIKERCEEIREVSYAD